MKDINEMTRKEFEALPSRAWDEVIICMNIIILPGKSRPLHDSGFRLMDFVAVFADDKPLIRLSGCSDVIHVDGIAGLGFDWVKKYDGVPKTVPPSVWSIDCLPKSGLLRMWPASGRIRCSPALSSFEIFALPKEGE